MVVSARPLTPFLLSSLMLGTKGGDHGGQIKQKQESGLDFPGAVEVDRHFILPREKAGLCPSWMMRPDCSRNTEQERLPCASVLSIATGTPTCRIWGSDCCVCSRMGQLVKLLYELTSPNPSQLRSQQQHMENSKAC